MDLSEFENLYNKSTPITISIGSTINTFSPNRMDNEHKSSQNNNTSRLAVSAPTSAGQAMSEMSNMSNMSSCPVEDVTTDIQAVNFSIKPLEAMQPGEDKTNLSEHPKMLSETTTKQPIILGQATHSGRYRHNSSNSGQKMFGNQKIPKYISKKRLSEQINHKLVLPSNSDISTQNDTPGISPTDIDYLIDVFKNNSRDSSVGDFEPLALADTNKSSGTLGNPNTQINTQINTQLNSGYQSINNNSAQMSAHSSSSNFTQYNIGQGDYGLPLNYNRPINFEASKTKNINEKRRQSYFHAQNFSLLPNTPHNFSIDYGRSKTDPKRVTSRKTFRLLFRLENVAVQKCSNTNTKSGAQSGNASRRRSVSQPIFNALSNMSNAMNVQAGRPPSATITNSWTDNATQGQTENCMDSQNGLISGQKTPNYKRRSSLQGMSYLKKELMKLVSYCKFNAARNRLANNKEDSTANDSPHNRRRSLQDYLSSSSHKDRDSGHATSCSSKNVNSVPYSESGSQSNLINNSANLSQQSQRGLDNSNWGSKLTNLDDDPNVGSNYHLASSNFSIPIGKIQKEHSIVLNTKGMKHIYSSNWTSEVFSTFPNHEISWSGVHTLVKLKPIMVKKFGFLYPLKVFLKNNYDLAVQHNEPKPVPRPDLIRPRAFLIYFATSDQREQLYHSAIWHMELNELESKTISLSELRRKINKTQIFRDDISNSVQKLIVNTLKNGNKQNHKLGIKELTTDRRKLFEFILQYMDGNNLVLIDNNTNICGFLHERLCEMRMSSSFHENFAAEKEENSNPNSRRSSLGLLGLNPSKSSANFIYNDDLTYESPDELIYVTFHYLNLIAPIIAKFLKITSRTKELIIQKLCSKFLILVYELSFHIKGEGMVYWSIAMHWSDGDHVLVFNLFVSSDPRLFIINQLVCHLY